MQLRFVSVHGPREPYFVDEPRNAALTTEVISYYMKCNEMK
jgi:hypothetical protein